ncbi:hypothetical protein ZWY2020_022933 [Hordeum vulgare]|nr:hypothetical protein ZWY2020_022933 [Hordeum vulgare]
MAATSSTGQKKFTVAVAVGVSVGVGIVSTPVHDQRVQRQACRLVGGSSRARWALKSRDGCSSNTQVPAAVASESDGHTLDGTGAPSDTRGTVPSGFGAENDDEAWSQPKEPHVGMTFDTLEGAKSHYSSYSLQIDFSIKMNTSRKAAKTGELVKQQFVCNNFRMPKVGDRGAKKIPMLDEIVDETTQYILRRWTPLAIFYASPAVEDKPDELPAQTKKELRHANLVMDFGSLDQVASASDATTDIVKKHMRGARHEIRNLNMSRKKKLAVPPAGPTGGPPALAGSSAPARSNTRAKIGHALDVDGPKEGPSVCRQQKSTSAAGRKKQQCNPVTL